MVERFQQADTNQPAKCPCAEMQDRYFMSGREPDRAKGWIAARKEGQVGNITIAEPAAPKFGIILAVGVMPAIDPLRIPFPPRLEGPAELGRASCRESVCQSG